jgi:virulence-associated protein VagC
MESDTTFEFICIVSHSSQAIKPARNIIFTEEFNDTISNIPEGVEHIEVRGSCCNLPKLPDSLKSLYINCSIEKLELPKNLEHLELGPDFDGKIEEWPETLKSLSIYDADINSLPDSLEYLKLNSDKLIKRVEIPHSVRRLILSPHCKDMNLENFHNLEHLEYMKWPCCKGIHEISYYKLPPRLKILKGLRKTDIIWDWNNLPDSLEYFEGHLTDYREALPKNIKVFKCPSYKVKHPIPESLEYLEVLSIEGQGAHSLPRLTKLKTLICEVCPKSELPSSLEYLKIKSSEAKDKLPNIPKNLKTLIVPRSILNEDVYLPETLKTLKIIDQGSPLIINVPKGLETIIIK